MTTKVQVPTLRVPMALIGPIYGLIAAIGGVAWHWQEADKGNKLVLVSLQKDVAELSRSFGRLDRGFDEYKREMNSYVISLEERLDRTETKLRMLGK